MGSKYNITCPQEEIFSAKGQRLAENLQPVSRVELLTVLEIQTKRKAEKGTCAIFGERYYRKININYTKTMNFYVYTTTKSRA